MNWCCGVTETKLRINREGYLVKVRIGTVNPLSASSQTHLSIASQSNAILPIAMKAIRYMKISRPLEGDGGPQKFICPSWRRPCMHKRKIGGR
jgi:hypothetical protein